LENQHRKIKGYRELDQHEIDLMNKIKEKAVEVGQLCDEIAALSASGDLTQGPDMRWQAIGKTDLQKGFMALTRSIAKPEFF
jgi:hypothetical protein